MFFVKFDKDKQKIISIHKDEKQFEHSNLFLPTDTVLRNNGFFTRRGWSGHQSRQKHQKNPQH
jgi:hypothetical protein